MSMSKIKSDILIAISSLFADYYGAHVSFG